MQLSIANDQEVVCTGSSRKEFTLPYEQTARFRRYTAALYVNALRTLAVSRPARLSPFRNYCLGTESNSRPRSFQTSSRREIIFQGRLEGRARVNGGIYMYKTEEQ